MSALHDPAVEAGAIALCWADRPCALFPRLCDQTERHKLDWWNARSAGDRDLYRYRASIVLEAVDEMEAVKHAAE